MVDDELRELFMQLGARITALSGLVVGAVMSLDRSQPGTIDLMIRSFKSIAAQPVKKERNTLSLLERRKRTFLIASLKPPEVLMIDFRCLRPIYSRAVERYRHAVFLLISIFVVAGAGMPSTTHGKSAKQVFDEVSRGIVVVSAMDARGREVAQGSGVVVSENTVATNCHVVSGAQLIAVRQAANARAQESYRMKAKLTAQEADRDLCILFVAGLSDAPAAVPVPLGNARDTSIGDEVYAIGAPYGLELSLSRGIVSQLRGVDGTETAPLIQSDVTVSPGSSGGGLFDQQGLLIGITTLKISGAGAGGFSFAIPVEWVTELSGSVETPQSRFAELRALYNESRERVRLRNYQIAFLRKKLARLEVALEAVKHEAKKKGVQLVTPLQLRATPARQVQELANYRAKLLDRLRQALGNRSDVRIVGDRFVFQSEVLFPSGEARLQPGGRAQIDKIVETIKEISVRIPADIDWLIRVDGHTDRLPISTPAYPSNWELSTGKAVAVVKYLIDRGVPANRLAATGFAEFQPIDLRSTIAAFRRNRRVEFNLVLR